MVILSIIAIVVGIVWAVNRYQTKVNAARRLYLYEKYKDTAIVDLIMTKSIWQGQSSEQLKDSLGNPECIDQNVMKTKTKDVWKYDRRGTNRYGLRITVENNVVVGWDKK